MNKKAILGLILIALFSTLALGACGSGGGDGASTSTCVWDSSTTWDNCNWGP